MNLRALVTRDVSFLPDIDYGNNLDCNGSRVPLMDTIRRREDGKDQQKMVDTALVADLLSYCRSASRNFRRGERPNVMAIIIGNDDDLLPGIFTAEQWGLPVAILRANRQFESKHIKTAGLVHNL